MKKKDIQLFLFSIFSHSGKTKREKWGGYFLFSLIVLNVCAAVLETTHVFPRQWHQFLWWFEVFSVIVFTIEYCLRLWVVPLYKGYEKGVIDNRVRFALRPEMIFDLAVILPFYLSFFFFIDIRWLRIIRLFRIFRTFRVTKYHSAFNRIFRVLKREKEELIASVWIMIVLLLISSGFLYMAEHNVPNTAFTSIPATFWWGIATLTTIGYGDMVPVTDMGKFFGAITAILGVGIFALPTGLIGSSFYHEVSSKRERQIRRIGQELDILKVSTEESSGLMEELFQRQNRKIRQLEKELQEANQKLQKTTSTIEKKRKKT